MLQCPKCKSSDTHRSRTRSTWEQWRKQLTSKRAYRCGACGWRGWGPDTGTRFDDEQREIAAKAIAPDPPHLEEALMMEPATPAKLPDLSELDEPLRIERAGPFDLNAVDGTGLRKS